MANICDNHFYFSCEHNLDKYIEKFNDLFENHFDGELDFAEYDSEKDGGVLEGWFNSRWSFPSDTFNSSDFIKDVENDPDEVYFRCLSEEYGCGYVAMNVYNGGSWWEEQTFDL